MFFILIVRFIFFINIFITIFNTIFNKIFITIFITIFINLGLKVSYLNEEFGISLNSYLNVIGVLKWN